MKRRIYKKGSGEHVRRFYVYEMLVRFPIAREDLAQAIAECCTNRGEPGPRSRTATLDLMRNYLLRYGELAVDIGTPEEGEPDGFTAALEIVDRLFPELKEAP